MFKKKLKITEIYKKNGIFFRRKKHLIENILANEFPPDIRQQESEGEEEQRKQNHSSLFYPTIFHFSMINFYNLWVVNK